MKEKVNKRNNVLIFLTMLIVTNIIFIPFLSGHLSTDSYNIFNIGYNEYNMRNSLLDGRIFMGIITKVMEFFNIPITIYTIISLELAIIISCIAIMVLANAFLTYKKTEKLFTKVILYIASYYTIFNLLYIENLYYIEAIVMALSVLLYIIAAKTLVEKQKYYLIKTSIFLLLGIMSYQGTISLFFLATLVLSLCREEKYKNVIITMVKAVLIALIGILINSLQIVLVEKIYDINQSRGLKSWTVILFNIKVILYNIFEIIKYTGGYLPRGMYIIMALILAFFIFIKLFIQNKKNYNKRNSKIVLEQISIIIFGILFSLIVSIINTSALLSGRIRFSLGAIIGFMFLHLWVKTDFAENKENIFNKILICMLILYGIINSVNYTWIMLESKQTQENDKEEVLKIQEYVENYEDNNDIEIEKIAVIVKKYQTNKVFYPKIYHKTFVTHSAMKTQWAIIGCYNYYTGEKLEEYNPTEEEINRYFNEEKNGYLCIDNVLYVTAYMY